MSSTLLVHPTSLALTTLPRVGSAPTPLQFPTRFPSGASPRTAMSPNGHTYLWADSLPVVWEYDSRGRRVGEIKLGSRERIAAVGCGDGVVIASSGSAGVWRRVEGKWTRMGELEAPKNVTAVECCGEIVVLAGDQLYAYEGGKRLPLPDVLRPSCLALTKAGILLPSHDCDGITLLPLSSSEPTTFALPSPAGHISASKTDRAAICSGTSLHFLSLSSGEVQTVNLPEELDASVWLDGANVAVRAAGRLFLVTMHGDVSEAALPPTLDLHVLPPKRRPGSRASGSSLGGVLGESSVPNRADRRVSDIAHGALRAGEKPKPGGEKKRFVSAPSLPAIERIRSETGPRERSPKTTPIASAAQGSQETPKNAPPRSPQSVRTGGTVRIQPLDPQATRMGAVIEESASPAGSVASRRVSGEWRPARATSPRNSLSAPLPINPSSSPDYPGSSPNGLDRSTSGGSAVSNGGEGVSLLAFEEMRREIANLQLDMLRMGRGLKNEIRAAVSPLVEEIRANRDVIARQREEIERLRRGY